jgi:hypothetical protein
MTRENRKPRRDNDASGRLLAAASDDVEAAAS